MNLFFSEQRMLDFGDNIQIHHNPLLCPKCRKTNKTDDHKIMFDTRASEILEENRISMYV